MFLTSSVVLLSVKCLISLNCNRTIFFVSDVKLRVDFLCFLTNSTFCEFGRFFFPPTEVFMMHFYSDWAMIPIISRMRFHVNTPYERTLKDSCCYGY